MNTGYKIITTEEGLWVEAEKWGEYTSPLAVDVETHPQHLLGIAFCPESAPDCPVYVPIWHFNTSLGSFEKKASEGLLNAIAGILGRWTNLVGHNFVYDKGWLDKTFNLSTTWSADTRIMWHLASAPSGPRPYGLKDAQKELLGWPERGDAELETNVKAKGGALKKGDHYLADIEVLAKYACLDVHSTILVYKQLTPFFEENEYWPQLRSSMSYSVLLQRNTDLGVKANVEELQKAHDTLLVVREREEKKTLKALEKPIAELEADWVERRAALYKREYNRLHYLSHSEKWEKFNFNSDSHKRELFYDKLKFPVLEKTEGGKPSTSADAIKQMKHSFVESYLRYEKANTLVSNFSGPYLTSVGDGRLHPRFNICGTVSYRLGGFKPYLLNAPFDEKLIMKPFVCDEGFIGIHADLSAIEPTITAHYSEDPSLLKVFRDGLGDIYLDLALTLFPNDVALQQGYNPNIPITKKVKEQFARQRKIAKVIQLAVQYTGTGLTVSKNLTKDGIPTTREEADVYVRLYWQKFRKVREFNYRLKEINRRDGLLRNVSGRIIRVPDPEYKDLSNRFIQSSAHDVLVLWVSEIYRLCEEKGIEIRPVLLDCHDSTSNQTLQANAELLEEIYKIALQNVNDSLNLCVTVKMEMKRFQTLAGLKGEET